MNELPIGQFRFKNSESPFTELFFLLKRYENEPDGKLTLAKHSDSELIIMRLHIDNAIEMLLQGLQDLGQLINLVAQDENEVIEELTKIGLLISGIGNLAEALNNLRLDTNLTLKERGAI